MEIHDIVAAWRNADRRASALATVVSVEGSTYRRPGARMLILPDGRRVGAISGGCLEADVAERARGVIATGEPICVLWDTRTESAEILLELGCRGAMDILIERADSPDVRSALDFLASFEADRGAGALATAFRVKGSPEVRVGERAALRSGFRPTGSRFGEAAAAELESALAAARPIVRTYDLPGGRVEAVIERADPPVSLLICGAGEDAVPLATLARGLGWETRVFDHRPALLTSDRFPSARALLSIDAAAIARTVALDRRTAAVIMTHNNERDLEWLRALGRSEIGYLGLLGPRSRAQRLLEALEEEGDEAPRMPFQSPAGLDIGSETPQEIALSILAEVQAVLAGRSGGFLRDRRAPIHSELPAAPGASEAAR
jgi:xanthine/CO dehydrogenase XdhC/CoxF family maturation factor